MTKLTSLYTTRVINAFVRAGWQIEQTGHKRPKHTILSKKGADKILSVPRHKKIKKDLLAKLIKQAGFKPDEFLKYYK